ncbi:hypothetical protein GJ496_009882 [Pomphorhynchus laevis]|nr:hypothetical protein GJ496_009882 [Pomphorhynchus laevis]
MIIKHRLWMEDQSINLWVFKTTRTQEKALLADYAHLFKNNGRPIHNYTFTLNVDSAAISKCYQSRWVPFHLREQVEKSLKSQVDFIFLEPIDLSKEDVKSATPSFKDYCESTFECRSIYSSNMGRRDMQSERRHTIFEDRLERCIPTVIYRNRLQKVSDDFDTRRLFSFYQNAFMY